MNEEKKNYRSKIYLINSFDFIFAIKYFKTKCR